MRELEGISELDIQSSLFDASSLEKDLKLLGITAVEDLL